MTGLVTSCVGTVFYCALLKEIFVEGRTEVTGRQNEGVSSYRMTLKKRGYWKIKEEAVDRVLWRTSSRRVYGHDVR